jgi:hypothetical protein
VGKEEELEEWVREMLEEGHEPGEIKDSLRNAGLDPRAVERAQEKNKQTGAENNSSGDPDTAQETEGESEFGGVSDTADEEGEPKPSPHTQTQEEKSSWYLNQQTAVAAGGIALILVSVAAMVVVPDDILTDQSSAKKPSTRTTEPVNAGGTDASGLSGKPVGLRVNISRGGVQPVNPSTDLETVSFVNMLDQPVDVYLSPGGRYELISPRRHIRADASSFNYFTVAMPEGNNVTGSIRE